MQLFFFLQSTPITADVCTSPVSPAYFPGGSNMIISLGALYQSFSQRFLATALDELCRWLILPITHFFGIYSSLWFLLYWSWPFVLFMYQGDTYICGDYLTMEASLVGFLIIQLTFYHSFSMYKHNTNTFIGPTCTSSMTGQRQPTPWFSVLDDCFSFTTQPTALLINIPNKCTDCCPVLWIVLMS